ncbi:MAG TPA: F0F1 ATP synthase subunit A [Hyphomicrobiales bacterium]|nr:F0F1 ATP synthase subunit A [Hyphomicrobiales bacterium]
MVHADPISQFDIVGISGPLFRVGGAPVAFTNSALLMAIIVGLIVAFMLVATRGSMVPGRLQSAAELFYEFTAQTVRESAGNEGMRFFPFVFTVFIFVLCSNVLGIIPGSFTVTGQIVITAALAGFIILMVVFYGFYKHGLGWLRLFVPPDVPGWLLPMLVFVEVVSFWTRPISLSVRLFANMLGGHMAMSIFAYFVAALLFGGVWAVISPFPLLLVVALVALELLVAVLQAYVFAILTALYLNDALHPHH